MSETAKTYVSLLREAYKGELLGEALFATMAARDDLREHAASLSVLCAIEAPTARTLQPLVEEAGITIDDADETRRLGRDLGAVDGSWDDLVKALHDALPSFLADFARLRELAPDPHDPALAALIAHEQTISAFAQLELAGHTDVSHALLTRYLETAP